MIFLPSQDLIPLEMDILPSMSSVGVGGGMEELKSSPVGSMSGGVGSGWGGGRSSGSGGSGNNGTSGWGAPPPPVPNSSSTSTGSWGGVVLNENQPAWNTNVVLPSCSTSQISRGEQYITK
jgi:hypothetical protein